MSNLSSLLFCFFIGFFFVDVLARFYMPVLFSSEGKVAHGERSNPSAPCVGVGVGVCCVAHAGSLSEVILTLSLSVLKSWLTHDLVWDVRAPGGDQNRQVRGHQGGTGRAVIRGLSAQQERTSF